MLINKNYFKNKDFPAYLYDAFHIGKVPSEFLNLDQREERNSPYPY